MYRNYSEFDFAFSNSFENIFKVRIKGYLVRLKHHSCGGFRVWSARTLTGNFIVCRKWQRDGLFEAPAPEKLLLLKAFADVHNFCKKSSRSVFQMLRTVISDSFNYFLFTLWLKNRQTVFLFIKRYLTAKIHTFFKSRQNNLVRFVYFFS